MRVGELMHFLWYSVHNPVKFRNLHTKAPILLIYYFTLKRMSLYAYWTKDEVSIDIISLQILDNI